MENRDRDRMSDVKPGKSSDLEIASFGQDIEGSEKLKEPSKKSGASGMQSSRGRSGSSDREGGSALGSERELNESEDIEGP